ncbi:hypothetical protein BGZ74_000023 [Mortierella antarctica]|nr:hypothetical protein BGZ74_000023 [Mortierella antarctica]
MSTSRAVYPANNRQIPEHLRVNGTTTIYCYGCNQSKPRPAFSESQLKKAATRSSAKPHHVLCKSCTPVQNTSLKCVRCNKVRPMECYSKTQRKLQERATCMDCRKFIDDDDSEDDLDIEDDPEYYHGDIRDVL